MASLVGERATNAFLVPRASAVRVVIRGIPIHVLQLTRPLRAATQEAIETQAPRYQRCYRH